MSELAFSWADPNSWPPDNAHMIFLPRAICEASKLYFEKEWTGAEPAEWLAARAAGPMAQFPSPEIERFELTMRSIRNACVSGQLIGIRQAQIGRLNDRLPVTFWQRRDLEPVVETCCYWAGDQAWWLYLDLDSFRSWLPTVEAMAARRRTDLIAAASATSAYEDAVDLAALQLGNRKHWSLAEALLWIATADLSRVAGPIAWWGEHWAAFTGAAALEAVRTHLRSEAAQGREPVRPDPWRALSNALLTGAVKAEGLDLRGDRGDVIPPSEWLYLELASPSRSRLAKGDCFARPGGELRWQDVKFPREQVMAAFEAPALRPTAAGMTAARRDLNALVAAYKRGEGPIPVGAKWQARNEEFGITPNGARTIWREVAKANPILSSMRKKRPRAKSGGRNR